MTAGRKPWYRSVYIVLPLLFGAFLILILPGASVYYRYSGGRSCARCHEIWQPYTDWHTSTHRNVPCADCHGDVFTLELGFHLNNIRRLSAHLRGEVPEKSGSKLKTCCAWEAAARNAISRSMRIGPPGRTPQLTKTFFSTPVTITAST